MASRIRHIVLRLRKRLPNFSLAMVLLAALVSCEKTETHEQAADREPPAAPVSGQAACDVTQIPNLDSLVGFDDGHGPDRGSGEWRHAIGFRLGLNPAGDFANETEWCQAVEAAVSGVHLQGYRDWTWGESVGDMTGLVLDLPPVDGSTCQYGRLAGEPGLLFMIDAGRLLRLDIHGEQRLPSGVGVGSRTDELAQAYPEHTREANKYDPDASELQVGFFEGHVKAVFIAKDDRVTSYRVGRLPQVDWVEGCL